MHRLLHRFLQTFPYHTLARKQSNVPHCAAHRVTSDQEVNPVAFACIACCRRSHNTQKITLSRKQDDKKHESSYRRVQAPDAPSLARVAKKRKKRFHRHSKQSSNEGLYSPTHARRRMHGVLARVMLCVSCESHDLVLSRAHHMKCESEDVRVVSVYD